MRIYYQNTPDRSASHAIPLASPSEIWDWDFLRSGPGSWASPQDEWDTIGADVGWSHADVFGAQRGFGAAANVLPTEGSRAVLQKEFFHTGYIKEPLKQLVHFLQYEGRIPFAVTSGNCPAGKTKGRLLADARGSQQP